LMKRCWDHNPENRPTAKEIYNCLWEYYEDYNKGDITEENKEIIKLAEAKRQEIIKSKKFLTDTKNYKHHPRSFYTSRLLNKSIEQTESLLNLLSTEIESGSKIHYIDEGNDDNNNGSI